MTTELSVREAPASYVVAVQPAISKGYKQTEVGVIPEDWEVKNLGELARGIFRGASPRPIDSPVWFDERSSIGWVRISDVTKSGRYLHETTQRLSDAGVRNSRYIPSGSLLMSICATVGRPIETRLETCIHDGFVVFEHPNADQAFLYHVLKDLEPRWSGKGQTGSQMNLNTALIKGTMIPLPSTKTEQEAIAEALSDADALIAGLEQLIAKKRHLKQGAMQELLTGKKRLPGFDGEWMVKRLGDIAEINKGQLITEKDAVLGSIPVIAGGKKPAYFHNQANRFGKTITVSASGASAGYVGFFDEPIFASDCSTIGEGRSYSVEYIYYQLLLNQEAIYKAQTGGAQPHIHAVDLMPLEIGCPELKEQTAIATVLSDMDTELASLEAELAKARGIKQGMMQELLTGRIRLV